MEPALSSASAGAGGSGGLPLRGLLAQAGWWAALLLLLPVRGGPRGQSWPGADPMAVLRGSQAETRPPHPRGSALGFAFFWFVCVCVGRIWGNALPCRLGLGEKEWPSPGWIRPSGRTRIQLSPFPPSRFNHRTSFPGFCFGRATSRPGAESSDEHRCPPGWPVRRLPRKSGARRPSPPGLDTRSGGRMPPKRCCMGARNCGRTETRTAGLCKAPPPPGRLRP